MLSRLPVPGVTPTLAEIRRSMEGAGIAQAAHLNDSLPALVIRGISDLADGHKAEADRDGWQHRASHRAAAFATALIASYIPQSAGQQAR